MLVLHYTRVLIHSNCVQILFQCKNIVLCRGNLCINWWTMLSATTSYGYTTGSTTAANKTSGISSSWVSLGIIPSSVSVQLQSASFSLFPIHSFISSVYIFFIYIAIIAKFYTNIIHIQNRPFFVLNIILLPKCSTIFFLTLRLGRSPENVDFMSWIENWQSSLLSIYCIASCIKSIVFMLSGRPMFDDVN